jgi:hypothetical protein|tara:strand:- start:6906 stop:7709 length:804 start_codon:yes stop_codon:yes gene_type:complete
MEKVELGGNIRVFAYFTSGGRFFALHGNLNQPLTTVTEVTHLSKSVNRGDAHLRRSRFECAIRQREQEGFHHVGFRKLHADGTLGELHEEEKFTLPQFSPDRLPDCIRVKVSDILSQDIPKTALSVAISGQSAGTVRLALMEAKTALKGQGLSAEIDDDFNIRLCNSFEGGLKPLFPAKADNTDFSMTMSDHDLKRSEFLPVLFWAIAQKMLSKENCILADAEGRVINNTVDWIFSTFGFYPDVETLAVQLGIQPDLSKINIQSAGF